MDKIKLFLLFLLIVMGGEVMAVDIIFKDSSGQVLTKDDLNGFSGTASWEVLSEKTITQEAIDLHNKGREFGQKGDYENSVQSLKLAAEADPSWAYPVYDLAFTHILMGDLIKAHEYYREVDSMAPRGFFTVKTALYTLDGERKGVFPKGLYKAYLSIEWMDEAKKIQALNEISTSFPKFAPAWKDLIPFAESDETALEFIQNGLSANPDIETYGMLMINRALILHRNEKPEEAIEILGALALNPDSSMSTEKISKQTLVYLLDGNK